MVEETNNNDDETVKNKIYRQKYYEKHKKKIQKYQKDYYNKYVKKEKKKKPSNYFWKGKVIKKMTITQFKEPLVLSFD